MSVDDTLRAGEATWQSEFLEILPEIERRLCSAFRHLDSEAAEDAIAEGVLHALKSFMRLFERGKTGTVRASNLAWYASKQVKSGRPAVGRMNVNEPLSRYAEVARGTIVEREQWIDQIVGDCRTNVLEQVAIRLDARQWIATLADRTRRIAGDLATGWTTGEVARKYALSPGRVSQLRQSLYRSWLDFQHEIIGGQ